MDYLPLETKAYYYEKTSFSFDALCCYDLFKTISLCWEKLTLKFYFRKKYSKDTLLYSLH